MPYDLDILGFMPEKELQILARLAKLFVPEKNGVIVEVGSFCGRSTVCWARNIDPSTTIYAYDRFPEDDYHLGQPLNTKEEFLKNTRDYKNIIPVTGYCPDPSKYTDDRKIDLFFLDALHMNPNDLQVLLHFLPHLKPNGLLAGHDYYHEWPDVIFNVKFLEELIGVKATIEHTVWYIQLPPNFKLS
jgi:hypothetical protein